MFKRTINELSVRLAIAPAGPLLIKAGDTGGADPTRPDMEFVRTWHQGRETIYLPGSSLKGMLRAHCEKIARTVAGADGNGRLSCNPLKADAGAADGSCGEKFSRRAGRLSPSDAYHDSCFVCQMYGNTALASRVRIADAYPSLPLALARLDEDERTALPPTPAWDDLDDAQRQRLDPNRTEERHGVAIDRVYGSVAVGPFNFETATGGVFEATLTLRNFTTAQVGLLALALRDLQQRRIQIGFAKSRGLGRLDVSIPAVVLRYPLGDFLPALAAETVAGVGAVMHALDAGAASAYGYHAGDAVRVEGLALAEDGWGGREVELTAAADQDRLWRACAGAWATAVREAVGHAQ